MTRKLTPLVVGLASLLMLLCASVPAYGSYKYLPRASFGGACSSDPCPNGQFKEPTGVAVNRATEVLLQPTAGDVYVIDTGDARVERFSATGSYLGQFDGAGGYETEGKTTSGPATPGGSFSFSTTADGNGIAVDGSIDPLDPSAGDVYVMDVGHQAIDRFSAVGRYEGQLTGVCPAPGACAGSRSQANCLALPSILPATCGRMKVKATSMSSATPGHSWRASTRHGAPMPGLPWTGTGTSIRHSAASELVSSNLAAKFPNLDPNRNC
jgi:hypothetical protein